MLPSPPPGPPRAARPRPPWSVVLVALGLAVAGLAVALVALLVDTTGDDGGGGDGDTALRAAALQAARERTAGLTTYDHRTLDQDFARVLQTATGAFAQEYRTTSAQLRPTFTRTQAVATGNVLGAGLEEFAPRRAVVVVAVDQVIRTTGAAPRRERNRLRMVLVRPDGTWLVERVQRL